jgi:hypothetical protein
MAPTWRALLDLFYEVERSLASTDGAAASDMALDTVKSYKQDLPAGDPPAELTRQGGGAAA